MHEAPKPQEAATSDAQFREYAAQRRDASDCRHYGHLPQNYAAQRRGVSEPADADAADAYFRNYAAQRRNTGKNDTPDTYFRNCTAPRRDTVKPQAVDTVYPFFQNYAI